MQIGVWMLSPYIYYVNYLSLEQLVILLFLSLISLNYVKCLFI